MLYEQLWSRSSPVSDICWSVTLRSRVPDSVLGQIFSYDYLVSCCPSA